uniref:8-oxo-dgdp phosphatase nudt18 n=1 Tax=Triatoma infestans TaxID=30076 RepID=A0A170XDU6_TRIIF
MYPCLGKLLHIL